MRGRSGSSNPGSRPPPPPPPLPPANGGRGERSGAASSAARMTAKGAGSAPHTSGNSPMLEERQRQLQQQVASSAPADRAFQANLNGQQAAPAAAEVSAAGLSAAGVAAAVAAARQSVKEASGANAVDLGSGSGSGAKPEVTSVAVQAPQAAAQTPAAGTEQAARQTAAVGISSTPSNVSTGPSVTGSAVPASTAMPSHPAPAISIESPLPAVVQRSLGDRSYDKRKNAALEVEALVRSLAEANNTAMIRSVIVVLSKDFSNSMNANYRKGGLIGIAATAIGLMHNTRYYLDIMLPPVLHCFDDPESRVRYYACESLYNIAKVARSSTLRYFQQIFDGLTKLFADVDVDVKNGASLLDRLIKDIVTETDAFRVEQFLPLLQNYQRRTNPHIRMLLIGWISVLDSVPDINMIDHLPDFLDGLFNMLSDTNREIRQAADATLSEFLREVRRSTVVEFGPLITILVHQCESRERLSRLTAITWIYELIHHPFSGEGEAILPYHAEVLRAVMSCLSDSEAEIRSVADRTNDKLLSVVRTAAPGLFDLRPMLDILSAELLGRDDVPTKIAALHWINMLLETKKRDVNAFIPELLPVLLRTLSDPSDAVVLLNLQVLSRISLAQSENERQDDDDIPRIRSKLGQDSASLPGGPVSSEDTGEAQFQMVLNAILGLFASDRQLLETRGSLIIRKLCVLLNAKSVYIRLSEALSSYELSRDAGGDDGAAHDNEMRDAATLDFVATMVQSLNLILLTATELHGLRTLLAESMEERSVPTVSSPRLSKMVAKSNMGASSIDHGGQDGAQVFLSLFHCWCHDPVATFSLCLLARAYDVAFELIRKFSERDVTVGFLMQIDKFVHLLESPVFVHLRLQLLDVEAPYHAPLLKSCYGLLMLLPQSDAFRALNDRLTTICNLRDNLGITPVATTGNGATRSNKSSSSSASSSPVNTRVDPAQLLARFEEVMEIRRRALERSQHAAAAGSLDRFSSGGGGGGNNAVGDLWAPNGFPLDDEADGRVKNNGVHGAGGHLAQSKQPNPYPLQRQAQQQQQQVHFAEDLVVAPTAEQSSPASTPRAGGHEAGGHDARTGNMNADGTFDVRKARMGVT